MLTERLVRTFVSTPDRIASSSTREQYGKLEGWVSILVNLAVFAFKLVPGILIGSVSLIADAFHSLGDVASSAVVIWGFRAAAKPSDREHPFGHGRIESIASLLVALLLFLTAWEFGKASVERLIEPRPVQASAWLLGALVVTMLVKEWLSRFSLALGTRISSSVLVGDAWHHRSDVLATGVVIVSLIAARFGLGWVDGAGGVVVSAFIAWTAVALVRESIDPLIGEAPSPQVIAAVREAALSVPGVDEVHDVIVHRYGGLAVVSLHVEVAASLDISRGHDIAEDVERVVNARIAGWSVVHVDPVDREHPMYSAVSEFLTETLPALPGSPTFHDLRIVGGDDPCYVIFDLQTNSPPAADLARRVGELVKQRFPAVAKVHALVEPGYTY